MPVIIPPKEFWTRKVRQIVQKYQSGRIDDEQLRNELRYIGYSDEDLDILLG